MTEPANWASLEILRGTRGQRDVLTMVLTTGSKKSDSLPG